MVEERLVGEELSLLALCDGERAVPLAPARDFKRIGEGDTGPNTGGMGSFSPVAGFDGARVREIVAAVHQPVVDLMRARGAPFHGVLYAGIMLTADGPRVLEFNARFGDPETQAVLPRLRSDLLELLLAASRPGGLAGVELEWSPECAVTVVLASAGYPASSSQAIRSPAWTERAHVRETTARIVTPAATPAAGRSRLVGRSRSADERRVTHAGTARAGELLVTAGGRVLNVTALADMQRPGGGVCCRRDDLLRRHADCGATSRPAPDDERDGRARNGGDTMSEREAPGLSLAPEPMQEAEVQAQLDEHRRRRAARRHRDGLQERHGGDGEGRRRARERARSCTRSA